MEPPDRRDDHRPGPDGVNDRVQHSPYNPSEVCAANDELVTQVMQGNGTFGNPCYRF